MSDSEILDKLMAAQGGQCFFCKKHLARNKATIEHLIATGNGGRNADDNRIACCKVMNQLLGSKSLKEKLAVILSLNGQCPNKLAKVQKSDEKLDMVIAALTKLGNAKPKRIQTLKSTISKTLGGEATDAVVRALVNQMISTGRVVVFENKLIYRF